MYHVFAGISRVPEKFFQGKLEKPGLMISAENADARTFLADKMQTREHFWQIKCRLKNIFGVLNELLRILEEAGSLFASAPASGKLRVFFSAIAAHIFIFHIFS